MLKPLKQFICDTCGQVIDSPKAGWIEWICDTDYKTGKIKQHSFRIVHQKGHSPLLDERYDGCYQHGTGFNRSHVPMDAFLDEDCKMAQILSFLDFGPYHEKECKGPHVADMREFVEFVRRLTIPYYEEARQYLAKEQDAGYLDEHNEILIYSAGNLQQLIETYGEQTAGIAFTSR